MEAPTKFRWVICGLLFYATTINYIDRSVFGVLAGDLQKTIGWHDYQFGLINAAFTLAYAIGFLIMGRLIDLIGTRLGYAFALLVWTCAGAGTSFARSAFGFGAGRFCLGLGEAGNFPAAIKTVAEWFPQKQRATATGIFNAGSNVGAILAPFLVPIVVFGYGGYLLSKHPELQRPPSPAAVAPAEVPATIATPVTPPEAGALATAPAPAAAPVMSQEEWTKKQQFKLGWPAAFLITPALAAIWIVLWLLLYRPPERSRFANRAEVALIQSDQPQAEAAGLPAVKWRNLLPHRQAWAFMTGKFLTDPIWWFYLFWAGKFFSEQFHVDLKGLAGPMILVYVLADFGSIAGGWLSSTLIKRGWTPNAARKTTMSLCAILILPVITAALIPASWVTASGFNYGMWLAATLIGTAAAAHQGFSANIFTVTSDMFPKRAVSSVVGLGGLAGALGGMILQAVAGVIKEVTHSYVVMFIIAGTVYVLAVVLIHLLAPRLQRVSEEDLQSTPMPLPVAGILGAVVGFCLGVPLSYLFQDHAKTMAASFGEYFSAIVTGDLFKLNDKLVGPALEAARTIRTELVRPLVWTPISLAVVLAVIAMILLAVQKRGKSSAAA